MRLFTFAFFCPEPSTLRHAPLRKVQISFFSHPEISGHYVFQSEWLNSFFLLTLLGVSNDPRIIDNALTINEAHWWELLLVTLGLLSMISVWLLTIHHVWNNRRKRWIFGIIFLWPLSIVYVFFYFVRQSQNNMRFR